MFYYLINGWYCGIVSLQIMTDRFSGFISNNEYESSKVYRLIEDEIVINELYVAMFSLRPNSRLHEAARVPFTVRDILPEETKQFCAHVAFLDLDLRTVIEATAAFEDGFWQYPYKNGGTLTDNSLFSHAERLDILHGYLRRDNGSREDKQLDSQRLDVSDDSLVSV